MKQILLSTLLALGVSAAGETWPFMTVRMTRGPAQMPEKMEEAIRINARYPGSCDEYWFAHGAGPKLERCAEEFAAFARFRKPCADAGIAVGFQQGVTLGHGSIYDPAGGMDKVRAWLHPFTDAAWQVGKDGRMLRMFCPRSPEVLAYEERYVETLCRTLNPVSLWLDDDLRMGFSKPDGCFCDRCLAAFRAESGFDLTRAELVKRLDGGAAKDDVRRAWRAFAARSLAIYGAAARRGADRVNPKLRLAYQSVRPQVLHNGVDNFPLLAALSGEGRQETAIRVGDGCYYEDLEEFVAKSLRIAYEAERCRASKVRVGSISYEQECYTREVLHKTPEAMMIESAFALAAGCDALTEYYWDARRDEPLAYYREFAETTAAWRPYLERVARATKTTRLGGTARFIGCDFDRLVKNSVTDDLDQTLACLGVPVTVQGAGFDAFYVTAQTLEELGDGDLARLLAAHVVVDAAVAERLRKLGGAPAAEAFRAKRWVAFPFAGLAKRGATVPTTAERTALLDAFDQVGALPVRVERTHRFRVYPRIDRAGGVAAVTVCNLSIGRSGPARLQIRRPAGKTAVWARPGEPDRALELKDGAVVLPALPGCQVGTVFFN